MAKKAFTLIEILIVVAIIALLGAIAVANLLRAKVNANESAAIASLSTISTGQQGWRGSHSSFASSLSDLGNEIPPYIDSILASGQKEGYNFEVTSATGSSFVAIANPITQGSTGIRSYCISDEGVLRYSSNAYNNSVSNCTGAALE